MRAEDSALRARSTPRAASAQSGAPRRRRAPARSPDRARLVAPPRRPGSAPRRARAECAPRGKGPSAPAPDRRGCNTTARPGTRPRTAQHAGAGRPPPASGRPRRCALRPRVSWRRGLHRDGPARQPSDGAAGVQRSRRVRGSRSLRGHRTPGDAGVAARQPASHVRKRAAPTDQGHEGHVQQVGRLVHDLSAGLSLRELGGFLAQLRRQQRRVSQQLAGTRVGIGGGRSCDDGALEVVQGELSRPARRPLEVTEPGAVLAHGEAYRTGAAVEVHAQQQLRVARRLPFHPQRLARPRPVDAAALLAGPRQRFGRTPHQSQGTPPLVTHDRGPDSASAVVDRLGERRGHRRAECEPASVQRHAHLRVRPDPVQLGDLDRGRDPAGGRQARLPRRPHRFFDRLKVESVHGALALHLRDEKPTDDGRERADPLEHGHSGVATPAVHYDLAPVGIDGGDHAFARQGGAQLGARCRTDHNLRRARVEPGACRVQVANSPAHSAGCPAHHLPDQVGVRPAAERGVQVDDGHLSRHGELLEARERVAAVQHEFAPAAQLHRAAVDHVDAGDDHRRTRIPRSDSSSLMPRTVSSPSWNTDAASTASAPAESACATWWRSPMPPEAITGTRTVRTTARNSSKSGPALVPSRSQLVSRISPAPSPAPARAHSTASARASTRPPCVRAAQPSPERRASIASTTHWVPNSAASSERSAGRAMAAVFTLTLSAPAASRRRASSTRRTPPPTVRGIRIDARTRATVSTCVARASTDAATSSTTISSAPWDSYAAAWVAGSPASRSSWKRTPFTTRPSLTSRQGTTRGSSPGVAPVVAGVGTALAPVSQRPSRAAPYAPDSSGWN